MLYISNQGGDQGVRRLDTNAYLEAFDRQSRHIIGYRLQYATIHEDEC